MKIDYIKKISNSIEELQQVNKHCVYKISTIIDGKEIFYVGRTRHLKSRLKQHINDLKRNKHYNSILQTIFDNEFDITISVVAQVKTKQQAIRIEKDLSCYENCYNMSGRTKFCYMLSFNYCANIFFSKGIVLVLTKN